MDERRENGVGFCEKRGGGPMRLRNCNNRLQRPLPNLFPVNLAGTIKKQFNIILY